MTTEKTEPQTDTLAIVTDAFQVAMGWEWEAVPAENIPSGRQISEDVAREVMSLAGLPFLFGIKVAQGNVLNTWAGNENMAKRTRRDWPTMAKALDRLTEEVVADHEHGRAAG